ITSSVIAGSSISQPYIHWRVCVIVEPPSPSPQPSPASGRGGLSRDAGAARRSDTTASPDATGLFVRPQQPVGLALRVLQRLRRRLRARQRRLQAVVERLGHTL